MSIIDIETPEPNDGFILTMNKHGYMLSHLDYYAQAFIRYAKDCNGQVVDIGAAYGLTTIPALEVGAKVTAVDLDERHLSILKSKVPAELLPNLTITRARFPDELKFEDSSIAAFHISRVIHFFAPETIIDAAKHLYNWLKPGGKIFVTAETPYRKAWSKFIPVYEKKKAEGDLWPGFVDDVEFYTTPERARNIPKQMLFLDPETMRRIFEPCGFIIEHLDYLARPEFPEDMRLDGRESVGIICRK